MRTIDCACTELNFYEANQPYLAIMYASMFAAAYYGLLRVGEITSGAHPIKVVDVHVGDNKRKILFVLRLSKMHWKDMPPQIIKITSHEMPSTRNMNQVKRLDFCPYSLINDYIITRKTSESPNEPFYVFQDQAPVKPHHMRSTLHKILLIVQLDPNLYGTHSFRVGRSVDLYQSHIEVSTIKKIGRWKSNVVYSYLC